MKYKIVAVLLLLSFSHCRFIENSKEKVERKIEEVKRSNEDIADGQQPAIKSDKKEAEKEKTIDLQSPVAVYTDNLEDENENNDLYVKVYPTKKAKQFRVSIKFGANEAESMAYFPDPDYFDKIVLRKGDKPNTCILGFIGKEGDFHELNEIVCSTTQIKINKLKTYYLKTK